MTHVGNLATLPVIITEPGIYLTRDGRRVLIHTIDQRPKMLSNGFAAKGHVERMFRGKMRFRSYNIWHVSGHVEGLRQRPLDIVARSTDQQ